MKRLGKRMGPLQEKVIRELPQKGQYQYVGLIPSIKATWSESRIKSLIKRMEDQGYVEVRRSEKIMYNCLSLTPFGIQSLKRHEEKTARLKNPPVRRKYTRKAKSAPKRSLRPLYGRAST